MAQNAGYYVVGVKELRAAMEAAAVSPDMLKNANQKVSEFVAGVARFNAPVGETGNLQASVRGSRQVGRAVVRAGSATVPYAGNRHYGWPGRPNPLRGWRGGPIKGDFFIINSAQQTEAMWLQDYVADINAILDKIAASTPS
jgi:hypothetical protein